MCYWQSLSTFVCSLAHLSLFDTKQMFYLSYIYTVFAHICLRQQMHHYPICLWDKCLICVSHKCEQMWQISYLDHILPTFISFQICFFIQCEFQWWWTGLDTLTWKYKEVISWPKTYLIFKLWTKLSKNNETQRETRSVACFKNSADMIHQILSEGL